MRSNLRALGFNSVQLALENQLGTSHLEMKAAGEQVGVAHYKSFCLTTTITAVTSGFSLN